MLERFLTDKLLAIIRDMTSVHTSAWKELSDSVQIRLPEGLHSRPATTIFLFLEALDTGTEVRLKNCGVEADARNIMEIICLQATAGTDLSITAKGPKAYDAISGIKRILSATSEG